MKRVAFIAMVAATLLCSIDSAEAQIHKAFGGADTPPGYGISGNSHTTTSRIVNLPNGDSYMGEMKGDRYHGEGTFCWHDGSYYKGSWKNGKQCGHGLYRWPNGFRYEGEWYNGTQQGEGTMYNNLGEVHYKGQWKGGKHNGQGTLYRSGRVEYEGEWKDSEYNGQGTYNYTNGMKYVGQWRKNERHGLGTLYTFKGEVRYEGEWKDDEYNGQGTYHGEDGDTYVGQWKNGKRHGLGTYTGTDGITYEDATIFTKVDDAIWYEMFAHETIGMQFANRAAAVRVDYGEDATNWIDGKAVTA